MQVLGIKEAAETTEEKVGEDEKKCEKNGISFGCFYLPTANQLHM